MVFGPAPVRSEYRFIVRQTCFDELKQERRNYYEYNYHWYIDIDFVIIFFGSLICILISLVCLHRYGILTVKHDMLT